MCVSALSPRTASAGSGSQRSVPDVLRTPGMVLRTNGNAHDAQGLRETCDAQGARVPKLAGVVVVVVVVVAAVVAVGKLNAVLA